MIKRLLVLTAVIVLLFGCAGKDSVLEYNKSAEYWYNEIIKAIIMNDLDKADSLYTSLASEHVASPLLSEALLMLTQANIDEERYTEANKYLDEYIKRFGSSLRNEYARYLKITAYYSSFSRPNRNQQLMLMTIEDMKRFIATYPDSPYIPMVRTMLINMKLGLNLMSESAAELYKKLDKGGAAEFYIDKADKTYEKEGEIIAPTTPWYRKWFE
ncbi:MAG: outer membrane protein assembly factor BamD [Campylobacteraceae bacterium]|jgi:outer membrane protein assembly factor BamD|nr:outer membrane protein assembly factor BamD [Campylobacteraceae bacterium]